MATTPHSTTVKTIWMIGHSNHRLEDFISLLERHEIRCLVDIRSSPYSRFPHFTGASLSRSLERRGIQYHHEPTLGGKEDFPPEHRADALDRVLAMPSRMVLMCSEGDYHACHRSYWIAPLVVKAGCRVLQILKDGSAEEDRGDSRAPSPTAGGRGKGAVRRESPQQGLLWEPEQGAS